MPVFSDLPLSLKFFSQTQKNVDNIYEMSTNKNTWHDKVESSKQWTFQSCKEGKLKCHQCAMKGNSWRFVSYAAEWSWTSRWISLEKIASAAGLANIQRRDFPWSVMLSHVRSTPPTQCFYMGKRVSTSGQGSRVSLWTRPTRTLDLQPQPAPRHCYFASCCQKCGIKWFHRPCLLGGLQSTGTKTMFRKSWRCKPSCFGSLHCGGCVSPPPGQRAHASWRITTKQNHFSSLWNCFEGNVFRFVDWSLLAIWL